MIDTQHRAQALEAAIGDLRGVRRARVEVSPDGVETIRVLVIPERGTPEVIEDIKKVAESKTIRIDEDKVQVIRVDDGGRAQRRKLSALTTERTTERFKAKVMLELAGDVLVGEGDSPLGVAFERRSLVGATLHGLQELLAFPIDLHAVRLVEDGGRPVALVTLIKGDDLLSGSAAINGDEHLAIVRATLDAVNRFTQLP